MNDVKMVLVVDDGRTSRMILRQTILAIHPAWQVEEAVSGEDALQKALTLNPWLILMDVDMPGMGGMAAAEQLRQAHPLVQIVLLTDNVQDAIRNRASALGLGLAKKPMTEALLRQVLAGLNG